MKKQFLATLAITLTLALGALPAAAQNIAIVNGKAVPKTRLDALASQLAKSGRPVPPEMQSQ
ncbi:MAG: peptidylprolyl isomerase, partial [Burkholderiaceae bacterium]|nr:peptidylprolyl isomerase [Burkholderiaceae bacterium]